MVPATYNLTYYRGNTSSYTISLYDGNGDPFDLGSRTQAVFAFAKERSGDTTASTTPVTITATAANTPEKGTTITFSIPAATGKTMYGKYYYDLFIAEAANANPQTVLTGELNVLSSVYSG